MLFEEVAPTGTRTTGTRSVPDLKVSNTNELLHNHDEERFTF